MGSLTNLYLIMYIQYRLLPRWLETATGQSQDERSKTHGPQIDHLIYPELRVTPFLPCHGIGRHPNYVVRLSHLIMAGSMGREKSDCENQYQVATTKIDC